MQFEFSIELKDEAGEGVPVVMPSPEQVAAWAGDVLSDWSKHEEQIGWRVTRVTPA